MRNIDALRCRRVLRNPICLTWSIESPGGVVHLNLAYMNIWWLHVRRSVYKEVPRSCVDEWGINSKCNQISSRWRLGGTGGVQTSLRWRPTWQNDARGTPIASIAVGRCYVATNRYLHQNINFYINPFKWDNFLTMRKDAFSFFSLLTVESMWKEKEKAKKETSSLTVSLSISALILFFWLFGSILYLTLSLSSCSCSSLFSCVFPLVLSKFVSS